jgi:hypothetical protein
LDFSKEDWLRERFRDRAERQPEFAEWRLAHPLQAAIWLSFCGYADAAVESVLVSWDPEGLKRSAAAMSELSTWLTNNCAQTQESLHDTFLQLLNAGLSPEQAFELAQPLRPKKRKGRPVSNRRPVLLAIEHQLLNPPVSWMQLALKSCQCGKQKHDTACRNRLRVQAGNLKKMLTRLGVKINPADFPAM